MSEELELYKKFIDGLVALWPSVTAVRVRRGERLFMATPGDPEAYNEFVANLTPEHRELLANMLDDASSSGIHDTLAYLDSEGYRFLREGRPLPHQPFATELHFDYIARREGDDWPQP